MSAPSCSFCGSPLEHLFCDLGMQPLSNAYVPPEQGNAMEPFYPLRALVCAECFLVQLEEFESPQEIFGSGDYAYFSSFSTSWLEHCKRWADQMTDTFGLTADSQVMEVASNDGYLLQYFAERGIPVLGIEPAGNTAEVARAKGIETVVEFFGVDTAETIAADRKADVLLGANVLAHVPDINDFVGGMKAILKDEGVITIEYPHLLKLIELSQWDTVYHEHFSYLSFSVVARIFEAHGLRLWDVEEVPTHGGSLRIYGCHADASHQQTDRAGEMLEREEAAGFGDIETYVAFNDRVRADKREILELMIALKQEGKSIVGYGAAAKGNTMMNFCGIGSDFLDYVCDLNPHKQGQLLPGTHVPIRAPEAISEDQPDIVLILPWNIRDEVMSQLAYVKDYGGRFVARAPELQIFG